MFRLASFNALTGLRKHFFSYCEDEAPGAIAGDEGAADDSGLDDVSPPAVENMSSSKLKTPMQFEDFRNTLSQGTVNTYDGMRVIVQKQLNLNAVVSHFYWMGSANTGQPIYQYRIILPFSDDKGIINVSTDMDFNTEGEAKVVFTPNIAGKLNWTLGDQQQTASADIELTDQSSATQFKYVPFGGNQELSLSYMQAITPALIMGGMGTYSLKANTLNTAFAVMYDPAEYTLAAQYDNQLRMLYVRKVNPNRVHLSTDLVVDETGAPLMSLGAMFMLKQGKVQLGIDSNMLLKSFIETNVGPGTTMQLSAEMMQSQNHYKFGIGLVMGG